MSKKDERKIKEVLGRMDSLTLEFLPGTWIEEAARDAVNTANKSQKTVFFKFNDISLFVSPGDNWQDIRNEYQNYKNKRTSLSFNHIATEE